MGRKIVTLDNLEYFYEKLKDFVNSEHELSEKVNKDYVDNSIAKLVDGAPETLNTLNELASALKDNADIVDVLNQSIASKQDKLVSGTNIKTINGQSLIGSGDLTIEGGLSEANVAAVDDDNSTLDDVETNNYKKEIVTINSGTVTLLPDKYYKNTGTFSALDISLEDSLDTTHISEYCLEFTTASSGTSLSVPDTIKWANGIIPNLENNGIYQLSIMNNLGICTKFI